MSALTIDANKAARLALATGVITKGQENSELIYEVIKFPKYFKDALAIKMGQIKKKRLAFYFIR